MMAKVSSLLLIFWQPSEPFGRIDDGKKFSQSELIRPNKQKFINLRRGMFFAASAFWIIHSHGSHWVGYLISKPFRVVERFGINNFHRNWCFARHSRDSSSPRLCSHSTVLPHFFLHAINQEDYIIELHGPSPPLPFNLPPPSPVLNIHFIFRRVNDF